jgi:DNA-directed RNA polymerase sigma subunit (sigma70/sigma32)
MSRYVIEHQSMARIPENKARMIGPLREAETELSNRFGREPTVHELADHMAVAPTYITKLRKMMHADILESAADFSSLEQFAHDPSYERVMLAYYSLLPDEKLVFDYSTGSPR